METTKNNNGGWKVFGITVVVLLLLALVGGLFIGLFSTGKSVVEDPVEEDVGEFLVDVDDNDDDNGITVLMAKIDPEEYDDYGIDTYAGLESAYTLTVIYNEDATDPKFEWSITEGDGQTVTITPSDDTFSCVVACSGAFTTVVVVTVTAMNDPSLSASCTCNYVSSPVDFYLCIVHDKPSGYNSTVLGLLSDYVLTVDPDCDYYEGIGVYFSDYESYDDYHSFFIFSDGTMIDENAVITLALYDSDDNLCSYMNSSYVCFNEWVEYTEYCFYINYSSELVGTYTFLYYFYCMNVYTDVNSVGLDSSDLLFGSYHAGAPSSTDIGGGKQGQ